MLSGRADQQLKVPLVRTGGQASPPERNPAGDARVVRIIRGLLASPRVLRLYPQGHQRVKALSGELLRLFASYFEDETGTLLIRVRGIRIDVDSRPLESHPELAAGFAFKLRRRRIRCLTIQAGVTEAEIGHLAELLSRDHRELLREGGASVFLDRAPHPHLAITLFDVGGGLSVAESEDPLPSHVAAALDETLSSTRTLERFESLREEFGAIQGSDVAREAFDNVVWDFFSRPEWAGLTGNDVKRAFESFLELAQYAIQGQGKRPVQTRIESLKSFFQGLAPEDLLKGEAARAQADVGITDVAYSTEQVEELLEQAGSHIERATEALRTNLEFHDSHANALLILCELMVSSNDADQYRTRRATFLGTFSDRRYSSASVARVLRYIAVELTPMRFESRDSLVEAVFDHTADEAALQLFLVSMTDLPDVARPLLSRFVLRKDPFPLLVRLMTAPLLEPYRHVLADKLLEAARAKQGALRIWARKNRATFFDEKIFEPLFTRGTDLLGGICKEILIEGPAKDRIFLIERLRDEGTETALRLLILGMSFGGEACDQDLLRALAEFDRPLARAALQEVIHRSNTRTIRTGEVTTALHALDKMGTEESWKFLWSVVQARRCLLPTFRRELRQLASKVLEGREEQ